MNKFRNAVSSRLHYIRLFDLQTAAVFHKRICIKLGNIHNRLVFSLGSGEHLVLSGIAITGEMTNIRDVHNTLHIITNIAQMLFKDIFHNVTSQISNVCIMINCGAACVHGDFSFFIGHKFFYLFCQCVVQKCLCIQHLLFLFLSFLLFFLHDYLSIHYKNHGCLCQVSLHF